MASELEYEILGASNLTVDGLRQAIQAKHDSGTKISAPHEPLLAAAQQVINHHGNVRGAFSEVVRGRSYAYYLAVLHRAGRRVLTPSDARPAGDAHKIRIYPPNLLYTTDVDSCIILSVTHFF